MLLFFRLRRDREGVLVVLPVYEDDVAESPAEKPSSERRLAPRIDGNGQPHELTGADRSRQCLVVVVEHESGGWVVRLGSREDNMPNAATGSASGTGPRTSPSRAGRGWPDRVEAVILCDDILGKENTATRGQMEKVAD